MYDDYPYIHAEIYRDMMENAFDYGSRYRNYERETMRRYRMYPPELMSRFPDPYYCRMGLPKKYYERHMEMKGMDEMQVKTY